MQCPTIEEILFGFPLLFYGSGGRTYVLKYIYIPSPLSPPFGKGRGYITTPQRG